ncbi:MAG: alanine dehydrogenase [Alphaproteobacteria bacterium]|jgi:alanine dehydrogenase|nr:alanine dehydrogenase [Alphaproteobacteria bacterium]
MKIGVPKEVKNHEYRVGLTPASARELTRLGHEVIIETNGGRGAGFEDESYRVAGARIVSTAEDVFSQAEMIIKVKEPQPQECQLLRSGQMIFTYLHLAPDPVQAEGLINAGCIAIAYETVTDAYGRLPLLAPMSEVAGRMSIQAGAHFLEKGQGGSGVLLGGVASVAPGKVVVLGGGFAGANAARMAVGLGAQVVILDRNLHRLKELDLEFGGRVQTIYSTTDAIDHYVVDADLVIGAILIAGAAAPRLVTREMIRRMRPGSVLVDLAIDQGGCFETSRPTTHADPIYVVDNIIHYCVTNMPGGVARTSTVALNNVTLPFILSLAEKGYRKAFEDDIHLRNGLNIFEGKVTYEAVARDLGKEFVDPAKLL